MAAINATVRAAVSRSVGLAGNGDSLMALGSSDWFVSVTNTYTGRVNQASGGKGTAWIQSTFAANPQYWNRKTIFWPGRNDVTALNTLTNVKDVFALMVSMPLALPHDMFRVLEVLPSNQSSEWSGATYSNNRILLNQMLADFFGYKFIRLIPTLQARGDGTVQDNLDITHNVVPTSLRQSGDATHLSRIADGNNSAGYNGDQTVLDLVNASIAGGW